MADPSDLGHGKNGTDYNFCGTRAPGARNVYHGARKVYYGAKKVFLLGIHREKVDLLCDLSINSNLIKSSKIRITNAFFENDSYAPYLLFANLVSCLAYLRLYYFFFTLEGFFV